MYNQKDANNLPIPNNQYAKIIDNFGTPVYVLHQTELIRSIVEFEEAFKDFPAQVSIVYPYKTNSLDVLCNYLHNRGIGAEVSSGMELNQALRLNVKPSEIVFNAVFKSDTEIETALKSGCRINADNFEDINRISTIARLLDIRDCPVGIRVTQIKGNHWDKFGFALEEESMKALDLIGLSSNLRLIGIHTHRSSIVDIEDYKQHISAVFCFVSKILRNKLAKLEYIDIGSGFAVDYPAPIDILSWSAPAIRSYSEVISNIWTEQSIPSEVSLIIEPGKRLVASSMILLTRVVCIKQRSGKQVIFVDAGQNLMPGIDWYRYPIAQVKPILAHYDQSQYDIHGCLCDSMDILGRQVTLANLEIGEVLAIRCVGGYDMSRSFVWQIPRAPVVWIDSDDNITIIRDREFT